MFSNVAQYKNLSKHLSSLEFQWMGDSNCKNWYLGWRMRCAVVALIMFNSRLFLNFLVLLFLLLGRSCSVCAIGVLISCSRWSSVCLFSFHFLRRRSFVSRLWFVLFLFLLGLLISFLLLDFLGRSLLLFDLVLLFLLLFLRGLGVSCYIPGLVTNSVLFYWLFKIKDRCKKVCFQQTHN